MASSVVSLNTKISPSEKEEFVRTAEAIGMSPSAVIKAFVHMFNACGGFPFELRNPQSTESVTYLKPADYDRFVQALDDPMPEETIALLKRDYS